MFIAGEASGDAHAAELITALRAQAPDVNVFGAGGPKMKAAGMELLLDLTEHAVVGLVEVLKNYGKFRRIFWDLVREAENRKPDAAVLVDFPHGRVPFSTGPVWLSLLTGAPLVAATIVATESGKYALEALPPLRPQWRGSDRAATVREFTLELASRFREPICKHPDQWYQFVPLSRLCS